MRRFKFFICLLLILALPFTVFVGCGQKTLDAPSSFTVDDDYVVSWAEVAAARGYELQVKTTDGETVSTFTPKTNKQSLSSLNEGNYVVYVRALGGGSDYADSDWATVDFVKNYESGVIYTLINNNTEYEITAVGIAQGEVIIGEKYRNKYVTSIGVGAFNQSSKITKVVVGDKVETIGDRAFYSCVKLTEVILPASLESIGEGAFQSCSLLSVINIPDGLKNLPKDIFSYCTSLKSVNLNSVEEIGEGAFANSGIETITLPDTVITLGDEIFLDCASLKEVVLGSGITEISARMFGACTSLTSVRFAEKGNLTEIGSQAFASCEAIADITLPDGLETIGYSAFYGDTSLNEVEIPDTVTSIGAGAFYGCKFYTEAATNGDGFIYSDSWLIGLSDSKKESITALAASDIKTDTVGIANSAFMSCEKLASVAIPRTVKYIGAYAFYEDKVLYSFRCTYNSELLSLGDYAFYNCVLLASISLNNGLKDIGSGTFYGCSRLDNNTLNSIIPDSVERIGYNAFKDTALYESPSEDGVIYAGDWVVGCTAGVAQTDENGNETSYETASVVLNDTVVGIADYAFYKCYGLTSIGGLMYAEHIGTAAFYDCYSLTGVTMNDRLTEIKPLTFAFCVKLTDVTLPLSIKSIGLEAFYGCTSLVEVEGADSSTLTELGIGAFYSCESLKTISFGSSLKVIPQYAFYNCKVLNDVDLSYVEEIEAHAFSHCYGLKNVTFGKNLTTIGDYAFFSKDLMAESEEGSGEWMIVTHAEGVYVDLPDSVKYIGNYAFFGCKGTKASNGYFANIGSSVEEIGDYAFASAQFYYVKLPQSLKKLGKYAFYDSNLKTVDVPSTIEEIGRHAFNGIDGVAYVCGADSAPENWDPRWNSSYRPTVWGCTLSDDGSYVVSVKVGDSTVSYELQDDITSPFRDGYDFVGWAYNKDAVSADITAAEIVSVASGTILYSVWKANPSQYPAEIEYVISGQIGAN